MSKRVIIIEEETGERMTTTARDKVDLIASVIELLREERDLRPEKLDWLAELQTHGMAIWTKGGEGYILRRDRRAAEITFILI